MIIAQDDQKPTKNVWAILLFIFILKIALNYIFHFIAEGLKIETNRGDDFSLFEEVIALVILAPVIETLVFQFGIQELVLLVAKKYRYKFPLSITISTLTFSITHSINLFFILMAFVSGVIYSALYLFIRSRVNRRIAFGATSMVHILNNLIEFLRYGNY